MSWLGEQTGISPQTLSDYKNGRIPAADKAAAIAAALEVSMDWLVGLAAEPVESDRSEGAETADDVAIDSLDLALGMGGTFVDIEPGAIEIEKARFSRAWLRKFTHSPPDLLFTTSGVGDSMMPTINDHDIVIIDRSERLESAMGDKIWAIVFGGVGMIKRLRPLPDGTVRIMSDNQAVRDELATDSDLHIIGRVVAAVRRY